MARLSVNGQYASMLAALNSLPLPELAAFGLVAGIPLVIGLAAWPLLRRRRTAVAGAPVADVPPPAFPQDRGLPVQWSMRCEQIEAGFERHRAAMRLHQRAVVHLGAIDHEFNRLWQDARAVMESGIEAH